MENIKRQFMEAAKSYASETNGGITVNNPQIYKAFRAGQDNAYELVEAENTSLKARIEVLENALKKNHQWALCLLADIEAGNIEYYEENRSLELSQDIAETTNLLK